MTDRLIDISLLSEPVQMMLRELTQTERALLSGPLLHTQMPLIFANGWRVDAFGVSCPSCDKVLPRERVFGKINRYSGEMCMLDAVGLCAHCNRFVTVSYRIHDNSDISGYSPITGRWTRWRRRTRWNHLAARIISRFSGKR